MLVNGGNSFHSSDPNRMKERFRASCEVHFNHFFIRALGKMGPSSTKQVTVAGSLRCGEWLNVVFMAVA